MFPTMIPTAVLTPDPIAICVHINRLEQELKIARRLLRVTEDARLQGRDEGQNKPAAQSTAPSSR